MILDSLLQFDAASSLAIGAGTQNSQNVLDLHATNELPVLANLQGARGMGFGDDPALKLLVQVSVTFTSGGAATLAVAFQGATDNGSGAPSAFNTWYTSPTYALATLVQGARLLDMDMPRPPAGIAIPRFLRLVYTVGSTSFTAGTVNAYIVLDRMDQYYTSNSNAVMGGYPPGITVAN